MLSLHRAAVDELAWRFQAAEAALGIHAQNIAEGGSTVFDELASHRTHMSKREAGHRHAVERMRRVDGCLAALQASDVSVLRLAFTPQGRATWRLSLAFELSGERKTCLLGFALCQPATAKAYQRDEGHEPRDRDALIRWLEMAPDRVLMGLAEGALEALEPSLAAYAEAMRVRDDREREERESAAQARREHFAAEVAALHRRLWGT